MNSPLEKFISHARSKGMDHSTIRMLLLSAGWKEKDIAEGLSAEGLDMTVPLPPDTGSARDACMHLLNFVALFTTVISLVVLYFTFINRLFPDPALSYDYASQNLSGIRWSMAAIIVSFPLFTWLSRFLLREMKMHHEKIHSGVRKWLTYLTLFVAASALIVDVITLVFSLLEGELSIRFLLKVLVVLIIAGLVFGYYLLSLRSDTEEKSKGIHKPFFSAAGVLVIIALVWGGVTVGSPSTERDRKFDDRRIEDLRAIQNEINTIVYGLDKPVYPGEETPQNPVPATLNEVQMQAVYSLPNIQDPETGTPYGYTVFSPTTYELCADFTYPRTEKYDIFWNHPEGHHCFSVDVTNRLL